jgi:hypothetical protein
MFTSLNVVRIALVCLRLQQALGNARAQARHRYALLGTVAKSNGHRRGSHGSLGGSRRRSHRTGLRLGGNSIFLGHTTTATGTCDVSGGNTLFVEDLARRRTSRTGRGGSGWSRSGSRCRSFRCFSSRCRSTGLGFGIDAGDQFARNNSITVGLDDLNQHAGTRRRNFQDDLVGFDVDQVFVARNGFADFLFPGRQGAFGDGLGKLGNLDFNNAHSDSTLL